MTEDTSLREKALRDETPEDATLDDLREQLAEAELIISERDDRLALVDRIAALIGLPQDQELDQVAFELWYSPLRQGGAIVMRAIYDPWTGKPVDKLSDLLPSSAGFSCDECGAEVINRCPRCGAPVCCPRCCFEANQEEGQS